MMIFHVYCVICRSPQYIAETSPASVRGLLISLKEAAIVGGILLGYLVRRVNLKAELGGRVGEKEGRRWEGVSSGEVER